VFTGIIDAIGTIDRTADTPAGRELRVRSAYTGVVAGESIALDGACLTVREFGDGWFTVSAVTTTLERTRIGGWRAGTRVNLERALRAGDRMGGHLVQGHVDAVGRVLATVVRGDAWLVDVQVPPEVAELLVPHGSVAVDGVSLTVNELPATDVLQLSLIEYTMRHTTLGDRRAGDGVHLEADVVGKYVRRLVAPYATFQQGSRGFRND
jgi:riboflavin synthase